MMDTQDVSSEQLLTTMLPNYSNDGALTHMWSVYGGHVPFEPFIHVPQMMRNSRVRLSLRYITGAILSMARFWVKEAEDDDGTGEASDDKKFIVKQINRWWYTSVVKQLTALQWGYSAHEVMYCFKDNEIHFDALRRIEPYDVRPVTVDNAIVGVAIQTNTQYGTRYMGTPKALWHVHAREYHPFYGDSRLRGAFDPWLELTTRNGAIDIRRLYFYKYAFQGDTFYYPPGITQSEDGGPPIKNHEYARQMLDRMRAGAGIALPSTRDPMSKELDWQIERGTGGEAAEEILEYPERLKKDITEGIGVPNELIEASETGSGYSGRAVPQAAFHGTLSDIVYWAVHDFNQQVIHPLLRHNRGIIEPTHEIVPFGFNDRDETQEQDLNWPDQTQEQRSGPVPNGKKQEAKFSLVV